MANREKRRRVDVILYGGAALFAVLGGGYALLDRPAVHQPQPPTLVERRANPTPAPQAPAAEPDPATEGPVPDLPEVPDLAAEPPPARRPSSGDPRMQQLGAEMRFLSRARELLADEHPAEALGVVEEHRRAFPNGVLSEEREAFALEALVAVGRTDEAERRYYDFLRAHPHSELADRLARLMNIRR